jgi:hypothetical protein
MTLDDGNGGFPEPPAGESVRVVRCTHTTCGSETRIRLPRQLPAEAVRRVVCDGCGHAYECERAEEVGRGSGASRAWRLVSIPIAAAAVIGALLLIRGLEDDGSPEQSDAGSPVAPASGDGGAREARVVREPTYTLALPSGWQRTDPPPGATFAARSEDRTGEAALWVRDAPGLDFAAFERRSLKQLRELAGSAEVADRVSGPTPDETIVRLESERASSGTSPVYEVTLRAVDPYRYYLSTTLAPQASARARAGARLIHRSFLPTRE